MSVGRCGVGVTVNWDDSAPRKQQMSRVKCQLVGQLNCTHFSCSWALQTGNPFRAGHSYLSITGLCVTGKGKMHVLCRLSGILTMWGSRVRSRDSRLSHALDYLVFWSMSKSLATLPNKAFNVNCSLLCLQDAFGSHVHCANAKGHKIICLAYHTHFLLMQKCHQIRGHMLPQRQADLVWWGQEVHLGTGRTVLKAGSEEPWEPSQGLGKSQLFSHNNTDILSDFSHSHSVSQEQWSLGTDWIQKKRGNLSISHWVRLQGDSE